MSVVYSLRKDSFIFLIGHYSPQIIGSKLCSVGEVLRVFFFNLREVKLSVRESATLVIAETVVFWNKARIPTREKKHCIKKLEGLYEQWRTLQKNAKKMGDVFRQKENIFVEKLDDLFDIAHADALKIMKIEEDKEFLQNQRKKGRPGFMLGIDFKLAKQEKRMEERNTKQAKRLQKSNQQIAELQKYVPLTLSSSSSSVSSFLQTEELEEEFLTSTSQDPGPSQAKKRRFYGTSNIITQKIVAALDKCKVSDRDAAHILIATAEALGHDIEPLNVSRSTIRRRREQLRKQRAKHLKEHFDKSDFKAAVIHWDGKLLSSIAGSEKVERLAVILTSGDKEIILGVPTLPNGTGKEQANAVFQLLVEWDLEDVVKALCCDTTASNTGYLNGACTLLEQKLEKDLLYLQCRHHILEIILKSVFDLKMPPSSGPNVAIFKRFQESWAKIIKENYKSGMESDRANCILSDYKDEILLFVRTALKEQQPRDDYREFLELTELFFEKPSHTVVFRAPGAFHHARWMAKAIYSLKIFLFRDEFKLTVKELSALSDICIFIVTTYVKAWFTAPIAFRAPNHDLEFLKKLINIKALTMTYQIVLLRKCKTTCGI